MFRRGLVIQFLLGAVPVAAAAWVLSPAFLDFSTKPAVSRQDAPGLTDLDALKPRDGTAKTAAFDVARITSDGLSVFAGSAPAHATVTVMADGVPVGTAKADEHGEWTLLSDRRIARQDPVLGLSTRLDAQPLSRVSKDRAASDSGAAAADVTPSRRMMRDFEDLVAAAREPEQPDRAQAAVRAPVPIPVQFVYREATFTDEGRKAAELLAEYLKLKKPESIVMTGHADERGSDAFNLELSQQRLETVATFLRENGFEGRLVLVPKGSSEPYQGVDRTSFDRHTLWQLDRRVELELGTGAQPHRLGAANR